MQRQSSYKVHMNTISNGELSDPLCDSVNRGLTLVRLIINITCIDSKYCQYMYKNFKKIVVGIGGMKYTNQIYKM